MSDDQHGVAEYGDSDNQEHVNRDSVISNERHSRALNQQKQHKGEHEHGHLQQHDVTHDTQNTSNITEKKHHEDHPEEHQFSNTHHKAYHQHQNENEKVENEAEKVEQAAREAEVRQLQGEQQSTQEKKNDNPANISWSNQVEQNVEKDYDEEKVEANQTSEQIHETGELKKQETNKAQEESVPQDRPLEDNSFSQKIKIDADQSNNVTTVQQAQHPEKHEEHHQENHQHKQEHKPQQYVEQLPRYHELQQQLIEQQQLNKHVGEGETAEHHEEVEHQQKHEQERQINLPNIRSDQTDPVQHHQAVDHEESNVQTHAEIIQQKKEVKQQLLVVEQVKNEENQATEKLKEDSIKVESNQKLVVTEPITHIEQKQDVLSVEKEEKLGGSFTDPLKRQLHKKPNGVKEQPKSQEKEKVSAPSPREAAVVEQPVSSQELKVSPQQREKIPTESIKKRALDPPRNEQKKAENPQSCTCEIM